MEVITYISTKKNLFQKNKGMKKCKNRFGFDKKLGLQTKHFRIKLKKSAYQSWKSFFWVRKKLVIWLQQNVNENK